VDVFGAVVSTQKVQLRQKRTEDDPCAPPSLDVLHKAAANTEPNTELNARMHFDRVSVQ
jgi:hypothetical protein